ncbi:MAG: 23S rRNA (adenine(2503)-C(2))-methyltransferase RlmN [Lachnospiraceae bacterium]|jgi:23S rRNA (adenine2503-C2)-methyltransferase|nr:23S rRNA (adenine(2503)-C(2))-methyltransferase RlmN [Lachnospiraceae bacterium]
MPQSQKPDIKSMSLPQLKAAITELGERSFRATQIYEWMHTKLAEDFASMTNLSASLRDQLHNRFSYTVLHPVLVRQSERDATRKYLFQLPDGHMIETVLMNYRHGNSVCISSQVGCRMGCAFCASTIGGLERSLTAAEMLEQIYAVTRHSGERVSNIVVMGIGEPLDNYDNLLNFINMISDENGLNISQRAITVSTCGLVPEIYRLAEAGLKITLALSLHAPTDKQRQALMPIARRYSLAEVMDACADYFNKTGRRVTFEYSLMAGENDSQEDATALIALIRPLGAHINLIPVNPVEERSFNLPTGKKIQEFKNKLEKNQINVTIRREMGRDIEGACGQLRRLHQQSLREENHAEIGCFD